MAKIIKEAFRGASEGVGKKMVEAGTENASEIVKFIKSTITTNLFGLGPEDEAKFVLSFKDLYNSEKNPEQKILTNFMNSTLSGDERDWLRRVIAEMKPSEGTKALRRLTSLPNDQERERMARAMGLIKFGFMEETSNSILEKINERKKTIERKKRIRRNTKYGKLERKYRFRFFPF